MIELEVDATNEVRGYIYKNECEDESEKYFSTVIGLIEDLIVSPDFTNLQQKFMEEHWREFDEEEENKLVYTEIFKKYISVIEKYIEEHLARSLADFNMRNFEGELEKRRPEELEGEIFEMLSTFSDFAAFKTMFLDYKTVKEGRGVDFSPGVYILKYDLDN